MGDLRILAYGDAHIQASAPYSKPTDDGLTTHIHSVFRWFMWLASEIQTYQPHIVVDLGDLFSSYGYVDTRCLHAGVECVNTVSGVCERIGASYCYVVGNHDLYQGMIHNAAFFPGRCFVTPGVQEVQGHLLAFVPYGSRLGGVDGSPTVTFTHADYLEVAYPTGRRPENGDTVNDARSKLVVNGHYHHPGMHKFKNVRVLNAGSVGARTFRDCVWGVDSGGIQPHGAWRIDVDGDDIRCSLQENPETHYWVSIKAGDAANLAHAVSEDRRERTHVRVEALHAMDVDADALDGFEAVDTVILPMVSTTHSVDDSPEDSISINPDQEIAEYVNSADAESLPDGATVADLHVLISTVLSEVGGTNERSEGVPLKLYSATLRNFLSLGDVSWDFKDGLYAVVGQNRDSRGENFENNGSGKTSLFEGILWTITGKTIRGLTGKAVVRTGERGASGSVTLGVGDDMVTLSRTQPSKGTQTLKVYVNEEDVTPRLNQGSYTFIQELLGMDSAMLMHLVFLMGGLSTSFTRLKPLDRFRLVESLVGDLSVFDKCATVVSSMATAVKTEVDRGEGELASLNRAHADAERWLTEATDKAHDASVDRDNKLYTLEAHLKVAYGRMSEVTKLIEQATKRQAEASSAHPDVDKRLDELREERRHLQGQQHEAYALVRELEGELQRETSLLAAGKCPTCGADTAAGDRTSHVKSIETKLADVRQQVADLDAGLKSLDEKQLQLDIQSRERAEASTAAMQEIMDLQPEAGKIKQDISRMESERGQLDQMVNVLAEQAERARADLTRITDQIKVTDYSLEALRSKLAALRYLYHGPSKSGVFSPAGVRNQVITRLTDHLNARCSEYSRYVLPKGQDVRLVTSNTGKTSKIDVKIDGVPRLYESLSAGEARRVDIVVHLALRDLACAASKFRLNLLVLDEVLDPLDDAGLRDVLSLLETVAGSTSIWVVTQNERLRSVLDSGILVVKDGGVSSITPLEV